MEEIELDGPSEFLRAALRATAAHARRYLDESQAVEEVTDLADTLAGVVEDLACYGGQAFVRDRIFDRIGAMFACARTDKHSHTDGLPGGGPYREHCAAR